MCGGRRDEPRTAIATPCSRSCRRRTFPLALFCQNGPTPPQVSLLGFVLPNRGAHLLRSRPWLCSAKPRTNRSGVGAPGTERNTLSASGRLLAHFALNNSSTSAPRPCAPCIPIKLFHFLGQCLLRAYERIWNIASQLFGSTCFVVGSFRLFCKRARFTSPKEVDPGILDTEHIEFGFGKQADHFELLAGSVAAKGASKVVNTSIGNGIPADTYGQPVLKGIFGTFPLTRG